MRRSVEISASANQESANSESSFTEFNPQADEADTNTHKPSPSVVTSQSGIKSEDADGDSVATDPLNNDELLPMAVHSSLNVKPKPSSVPSDINVKNWKTQMIKRVVVKLRWRQRQHMNVIQIMMSQSHLP